MTTDDGITWEDPPRENRRAPVNPQYAAQRKAMRNNPGRWLVWARDARTIRTTVTRLRAEGFDAISRTGDDGKVTLYARWPERKGGES